MIDCNIILSDVYNNLFFVLIYISIMFKCFLCYFLFLWCLVKVSVLDFLGGVSLVAVSREFHK